MAYGQKAFRKVQISNVEGTVGSAEAATEILFQNGLSISYTDKLFHMFDQDRGLLAANVETPLQVSDQIEFEMEGELYDRLANFIFSNSIRGNITPSQPDSMNEPNHYLWVYEPSLTAPNTPDQTNGIDTFTLEYGDNVQAYETEYLHTIQWEISGAPNEPVMISWSMAGRQVTETTFTGALTAPSAAYFPFNLAKFYIETDAYASIGSTQVTGLLKGFTITFETMFTRRWTADGNYYFTALNEDKKKMQWELIYQRDGTNSEAQKDLFESQGTAYMRLELLSDTEMDSGQSNPEYIYIDGAVKYTEWGDADDEEGMATVTVTGETFYDVTAAKQFTVSVGTTMSAFA